MLFWPLKCVLIFRETFRKNLGYELFLSSKLLVKLLICVLDLNQFVLDLNALLAPSCITIVRFWSTGFQLCDFSPRISRLCNFGSPGFQVHDFGPPGFMIVRAFCPPCIPIVIVIIRSVCHYVVLDTKNIRERRGTDLILSNNYWC